MKKIFCAVAFSLIGVISLFGQVGSDIINGKTFVREVSSVCRAFKDGGCLITTYHTLTFENNTVVLAYQTTADCDVRSLNSSKEEKGIINTYTYQLHKKKNSPNYIIRINGYNGFEVFPDRLVELPPIDNPYYPEESKIIFELNNKGSVKN